ncbi:hypothetical protein DEK21_22580 [Salmonella enterica]|nr:hypothetical protein [Salmonella enterica]
MLFPLFVFTWPPGPLPFITQQGFTHQIGYTRNRVIRTVSPQGNHGRFPPVRGVPESGQQRLDWLIRRGKLPASLQTGEDMTGLIGSGLTLRTVYENAQGEKRLIVSVTDNVVLWKTADPELPAGGKSQGSATLASFRRWISSEHPASGVELEAFDKVLHRRKYAQQTTREIRAMKNRIRQER